MEPKIISRLSRKERRKKEKKNRPNKRQTLLPILAVSITAISICLLGYYYLQSVNQKREIQKAAAAEKEIEQELLTTIDKQQKKLGNKEVENTDVNDHLQELIYLPTTAQRQTLTEDLETLLTETSHQIEKGTPAKLVGYIKKEDLFGKIASYSSVIEVYKKKQDRWEADSSTQGKSHYMNKETADFPSMADIFQNQDNLTAIQPFIKQQLLDDSKDQAAVIDQILNFPQVTMEQKILSYSPDKVVLSLPKNQLNIDQISVPFSNILDFTDQGFIDPTIITEHTPPPLDSNKKYISLTFDDGPNPITTPRLLDILMEKNVKATFFMLGQNVVNNPDLVRRVAAEGHVIGSHSYSHPNLTGLDPESVKSQVQETDKAIAAATGKIPTDFRPPYGAVNKDAAEIIGRPIIQWSVDSEDWKTKNTEKIIKRVMKTSYNNSIILMHDIYPETINAVPQIIDALRSEGYDIILADDLITEKQEPLHMYYGNKSEQVIQ